MAELIAGILLVAGALYLVLKPVFQPRFAEVGKGDGGSVEGGEDPDDDLSPGAVALRALKEIEFDRATGKLSDADYDALNAEYTAAALAALRAEPRSREAPPPPAAQRAPAVAGPTRLPASAPVCPTHGPRPEPDAVFCSAIGQRRGAGGGAGRAGRGGPPEPRAGGRLMGGKRGGGHRQGRRHGAHLLGPAPRGPGRPAAGVPS